MKLNSKSCSEFLLEMLNSSNRRQSSKGIFKLGSSASKLSSSSKSGRQLNLAKHLPSALRKKTRSDSTNNKDNNADSPLIQDNPIEDVMAKYQTLTKKEEPSVGQLINLEIGNPG